MFLVLTVVWGSPRCNALGYNGFVNSFSATAELVSTTSYYTFGSGRIAYPGVIQSAFTSNETLSSGSYSLQSPGMTYRFNLLNSSVSGEDINTISLFGMCNMYFNWLVYDQNGKNTRIMHVAPSSAQMYVNGTPITTTISGNNITWTDLPTGISSDSLVSVYLDITFDEFAFSFSIPDGGRLERDIGCTFTGSYLVAPSDRDVLVDVQNTLNDLASFLAERFDVDLSSVYNLLLNIYSDTGNIRTTLTQVYTILGVISTKLDTLHSDNVTFRSVFQAAVTDIISTLQSESDDIQQKIEDEINKVLGSLNESFENDKNSAVASGSDSLNSQAGALDSAEAGFQDSASQSFQDINNGFNSMMGESGTISIVNAFSVVGQLFQRVWDALGYYNFVFLFPLFVSLALVVIGRIARATGARNSGDRGDGDSKDGG